MNTLLPNIRPEMGQVIGAVYESDDPSELSQDMLEVVLPTGVLIAVGWVPDGSSNGHYEVTVSKGLEMLSEPICTESASRAVSIIEQLAQKHDVTHGRVRKGNRSPLSRKEAVVMRETAYAKELARATISFCDAGEGRIERLWVKEQQQVEVRFSWWRDRRMMMRPLDLSESSLIVLLREALAQRVFSDEFVQQLRCILEE